MRFVFAAYCGEEAAGDGDDGGTVKADWTRTAAGCWELQLRLIRFLQGGGAVRKSAWCKIRGDVLSAKESSNLAEEARISDSPPSSWLLWM